MLVELLPCAPLGDHLCPCRGWPHCTPGSPYAAGKVLFLITLPFKSISCLPKNPTLLNPHKRCCLAFQAEGGDAFHNLCFLSCFPQQCHCPIPKFHSIKFCRSELRADLQKAWRTRGRETHRPPDPPGLGSGLLWFPLWLCQPETQSRELSGSFRNSGAEPRITPVSSNPWFVLLQLLLIFSIVVLWISLNCFRGLSDAGTQGWR